MNRAKKLLFVCIISSLVMVSILSCHDATGTTTTSTSGPYAVDSGWYSSSDYSYQVAVRDSENHYGAYYFFGFYNLSNASIGWRSASFYVNGNLSVTTTTSEGEYGGGSALSCSFFGKLTYRIVTDDHHYAILSYAYSTYGNMSPNQTDASKLNPSATTSYSLSGSSTVSEFTFENLSCENNWFVCYFIMVEKTAHPSTPSGTVGSVDGQYSYITGLNSEMEILGGQFESWTRCSSGEFIVDPGNYSIRYAASGKYLTGNKQQDLYVGPFKPDTSQIIYYTYNGQEQTFDLKYTNSNLKGFEYYDLVTRAGETSGKVASGYWLKATLQNPNFPRWADGTSEDVTQRVEIDKKSVELSDLVISNTEHLYNGESKQATVTFDPQKYSDKIGAIDVTYKSKDGTETSSRTDPGEYSIWVSVHDFTNFKDKAFDTGEVLTIYEPVIILDTEAEDNVLKVDEQYAATEYPLKVSVKAGWGTPEITIDWTWYDSLETKKVIASGSVAPKGDGKAVLELSATHVAQSGVIVWTASAPIYNTYDSDVEGTNLVVRITPVDAQCKVESYEGTYDGQPHTLTYSWKFLDADKQILDPLVRAHPKLGTGGNENETLGTATYAVDRSLTYRFEITGYDYASDYTLGDAVQATLRIDPLQLEVETLLNGSGFVDGKRTVLASSDNVLSVDILNLIGQDEGMMKFQCGEESGLTLEGLNGKFATVGTYGFTMTVSAAEEKDYSGSYTAFTETYTVVVTDKQITIDDLDVKYPDGVEVDDEGDATGVYDGTGKGPTVTVKEPLKQEDFTIRVVYYDEDGNRSETDPTEPGTYEVYAEIDSKDSTYAGTTGKGIFLGTLTIDKAPVEIIDFTYDLVKSGEDMTMVVTLRTVGELTGDPAISYQGSELPMKSIVSRSSGGDTVTTVVYSTSDGMIPAGTFETVTVSHPGDARHKACGPAEYQIRTSSQGDVEIDGDGGDVPVTPGSGTTVQLPSGEVEIETDGTTTDGSNNGGTPIVHFRMWYASDDESIPGADETVLIEANGYMLMQDGTQVPMKYSLTPTVYIDVPYGKKPVVRLIDGDGSLLGSPDITYTSNSLTFGLEAEGAVDFSVAVTFEAAFVPIGSNADDVGKVQTDADRVDAADDGWVRLAVIAGCVLALVAVIVLAAVLAGRRKEQSGI